MREKLKPNVERKRHYDAFVVYRDLGFKRSKREVAKIVGASPMSICKWSHLYHWDERLEEHSAVVKEQQQQGTYLVKADDPAMTKVVTMLEQIEAIIDSVFVPDVTGKVALNNRLEVKSVDELTRVIAEYRKLLEVYKNFVDDHRPKGKEEGRGAVIKEFNLNMGNMSQEERTQMLERITHGNVVGGDNRPATNVQEADFTEVSGRGDEDGPGREGVSGGVAGGKGGDKASMRKS